MCVEWNVFESKIDKFMNPKTHIAHTTLVAVSVIMTVVYSIFWKDSSDNGLALTNILILRTDELQDRTVDINKATQMFQSLSEEDADASSTGSACREASRPLPSGPHLPVSRSRLST